MKSRIILSLLLLSASGDHSSVSAQSLGTFVPTGNLTRPRQHHTPTLLTNGKVLIAGGNTTSVGLGCPNSPTVNAELYDPSTGNSRESVK